MYAGHIFKPFIFWETDKMAKRKLTNRFTFENEKKFKISDEVAYKQIKQLCKKYDIEAKDIEGEDNGTISGLLEALVEYVRLGYLEIKENCEITQHLVDTPGEYKALDYGIIGGKARRATDGFDENEKRGKVYALLDSICKQGKGLIENLTGVDNKVAEMLGMVFLLT